MLLPVYCICIPCCVACVGAADAFIAIKGASARGAQLTRVTKSAAKGDVWVQVCCLSVLLTPVAGEGSMAVVQIYLFIAKPGAQLHSAVVSACW